MFALILARKSRSGLKSIDYLDGYFDDFYDCLMLKGFGVAFFFGNDCS